jgi:hypothetical protein
MQVCDIGAHSCVAGAIDAGPDGTTEAGGSDAQGLVDGAADVDATGADASDAAGGSGKPDGSAGPDGAGASDASVSDGQADGSPSAAAGGSIEGGGLSCSVPVAGGNARSAPLLPALAALLFEIRRRRRLRAVSSC